MSCLTEKPTTIRSYHASFIIANYKSLFQLSTYLLQHMLLIFFSYFLLGVDHDQPSFFKASYKNMLIKRKKKKSGCFAHFPEPNFLQHSGLRDRQHVRRHLFSHLPQAAQHARFLGRFILFLHGNVCLLPQASGPWFSWLCPSPQTYHQLNRFFWT